MAVTSKKKKKKPKPAVAEGASKKSKKKAKGERKERTGTRKAFILDAIKSAGTISVKSLITKTDGHFSYAEGKSSALRVNNTVRDAIDAGIVSKDDDGNVIAKGSPTHAAAVVGDTVGDPLKDCAGPSLHVLVKLLSTITLVMVPIFI